MMFKVIVGGLLGAVSNVLWLEMGYGVTTPQWWIAMLLIVVAMLHGVWIAQGD